MGKLLFSFNGRIGRGGLWLTFVVSTVVYLLGVISSLLLHDIIDTAFAPSPSLLGDGEPQSRFTSPHYYILLAFVIVAAWIFLAGAVKRCHDRGKTGFWALLSIVPLVGTIWYIIDLGVLEGDEGPNKYGPDPRGAQVAAQVN